MDDYFQAKRRLFTGAQPPPAAVSLGDEWGRSLARELADVHRAPIVTFGLDAAAEICPDGLELSTHGSRFRAAGIEIETPLRGLFNVENVLGAVAAGLLLDLDEDAIAAGISRVFGVPGRFEAVDEGQPFAVFVDYAHTPDSLENVLRAAREVTRRRLHVIFGAGGDRDRGKRPLMGEAARRLSDRVVVTSDNPRSEQPEAIIDEVIEGAGPEVEREVDRRRAITRVIEEAEPGDVVVIAGKGHEQGQEFENGRKEPFDDVTVAREALRARLGVRA
jgi:UDP-N-acetylmuramoyl-L-alanyl-D-glutamate--2,6-diaminopimelate ligase